MAKSTISKLAGTLIYARSSQKLLSNAFTQHFNDSITSISQGYEIQNEIIAQSTFGRQTGWKIGATNDSAKKLLGFGPFYGPLFEGNFMDGKSVNLGMLGQFRAIEAEIGFVMNKDFPPLSNGKMYDELDIWSGIEEICPSIEIAASRVTGQFSPPLMDV